MVPKIAIVILKDSAKAIELVRSDSLQKDSDLAIEMRRSDTLTSSSIDIIKNQQEKRATVDGTLDVDLSRSSDSHSPLLQGALFATTANQH